MLLDFSFTKYSITFNFIQLQLNILKYIQIYTRWTLSWQVENFDEKLNELGSDRILKDKILSIQIENPSIAIEKAAFEVKAIHEEKARLEPAKNALNKGEMKEIYSKSILMSGWRDSNPWRPLWKSGILPLNYTRIKFIIFKMKQHQSSP